MLVGHFLKPSGLLEPEQYCIPPLNPLNLYELALQQDTVFKSSYCELAVAQ